MVTCPMCGHEVDWVTVEQAAALLSVSRVRVQQLVKEGRIEGAFKDKTPGSIVPFWKLPIKSVLGFHNMRQKEYGLV